MEMIEIYERIEFLRKKHKISQGKFEQELGFSNGSISKWKTSMPNSKRLQKLADYFNVSVEYLITGQEKEGGENYYLNEKTRELAKAIFENEELSALFDIAKNSSPEDLQIAKDILLALKKKEEGYIH